MSEDRNKVIHLKCKECFVGDEKSPVRVVGSQFTVLMNGIVSCVNGHDFWGRYCFYCFDGPLRFCRIDKVNRMVCICNSCYEEHKDEF